MDTKSDFDSEEEKDTCHINGAMAIMCQSIIHILSKDHKDKKLEAE